ncbi:unnamed protein product [Phyllotreta striolata]|uniref:Uncharacterized protein n=1 Tax=Phyllotreta striolata TaxID=444603 RepID=A0A9N9TPI3_PHYSR|nr:unnamed protein product [Phyllotreta striolata]
MDISEPNTNSEQLLGIRDREELRTGAEVDVSQNEGQNINLTEPNQIIMGASNSSTNSTPIASREPLTRPHIIAVTSRQRRTDDANFNRRLVDLRYELMKRKVDFLRLKQKMFLKAFHLRMRLMRTQLTLEEKKLSTFRKKYRR